jgi:hypothetical protein
MLAVLEQSPAVVLAVLVWLELRAMRQSLTATAAAIAVIVDRAGR